MDLTYMPGELDYKNEKKSNDSDMKREHDSVDDFEHLDPDSSPVDSHSKDFSTIEKFENMYSSSEKLTGKDVDTSVKLLEEVTHDELDLLAKNTESLADCNISSSIKDLKSDFDDEVHQIKSKVDVTNEGSSLLDFGISSDIPPTSSNGKSEMVLSNDKSEIDAINKKFISSEIGIHEEKTENESDLLNLGHETENGDKFVKDLPLTDDHLNKQMSDKDITKEELDFDNTKSMKEADALSQYEIKPEKKDIGKKDELIEESSEPAFKQERQEAEPEPAKPETPLPIQQLENVTEELHESKLEPSKIQEESPEESHELPSKEDNPLKHFIAVCPPKPSSASDTVPSFTSDTVKEVVKKVSISDLDDIIGPEDVFKRIGLVEALVYWRDPKKSGVVFGSIMAILLSLCYMSLISVVAYSSLLALTGTVCFRIYKNILQAVQKTSEGHPFKEFLELELSLPQDKVREIVDTAVVHINAAIVELRRLFLVEDLVDSIKFGVCLWCLTYVGAIFNGMTLVILAFVALFTVPKIYENNKASIDTYIDMGRSKVAEITSKVKAAVPIGKKEPEKDKEQ
ncbi:reticulon-1 isoform X3 [Homalodisca vitripennis]|uniref:reticulon-1 isoform X3 n=1 Tax=Homalodisca vitripennis TaxID=197043 RepID=UPI001EEC4AF4|nr:reticulon-1 isoform X3 [Homalodisca vitripennis]